MNLVEKKWERQEETGREREKREREIASERQGERGSERQ